MVWSPTYKMQKQTIKEMAKNLLWLLDTQDKATAFLKKKKQVPLAPLAVLILVAAREADIEEARGGADPIPEPLTMTELSKKRGVSTAASTGAADSAEKLGLVERIPKVGDRRVNHLVSTKLGRELVKHLAAAS